MSVVPFCRFAETERSEKIGQKLQNANSPKKINLSNANQSKQ